MIKLIILSIGIVLVFEGLVYYFLSSKLKKLFEYLIQVDNSVINTLSIIMISIGCCLIYFTFRFYGN